MPVHVYQLDPSAGVDNEGKPWGPSACMAAAAVMALDDDSRGAIRATMAQIRAAQGDKDGGIGLDDVATAWRRGWNRTFRHYVRSWSYVLSTLRTRGVVVTINYGKLGTWRAPGSGFRGAHALYLASGGTGGIVVHDPLRRGPVTIPEPVVRAAYTLGVGHGIGEPAPVASSLPRTVAPNPDGTCPPGYIRPGGAPYCIPRDDPSVIDPGAAIGGAIGGAVDQLGDAIGDAAMRAGIVAGIAALALLGVWLTFREPGVVVRT